MHSRRFVSLLLELVLFVAAPAHAWARAGERVLVVPFENTRHEPAVYWLSEASAVLLANELSARGVGAITRAERVRAFEQLHLPLSASLSRATLIKVGELVGASEVMVGGYALADGRLTVQAHSIRMDVGRLEPEVSVEGAVTGIFSLYDTLAQRLKNSIARPGARPPRPPLEAFENFIKGLIAESPAVQATFLETAIRLFPGYDDAQLALWEVRTEQGDHAAALAAARAIGENSPLAAKARFFSGLSLLSLKRYDEAFGVFKTIAEASEASGAPAARGGVNPAGPALNNLGVLLIRRGATAQTGSAVFYLTKAADADAGDADYLFNLGYAYALERNYQGCDLLAA